MGNRFLLIGFLFLLLVIQPIPEINASEVPIPERNFNTGSSSILDIFVMDKIVYSAEKYDGFRMLNVSDPSNPQELWHFPLNNFTNNEKTIGNPGVLIEAQLVHVVNNTAFFSTIRELYIFDVSNPRDPVFLGLLEMSVYDMASKNNFLYVYSFGEIIKN